MITLSGFGNIFPGGTARRKISGCSGRSRSSDFRIASTRSIGAAGELIDDDGFVVAESAAVVLRSLRRTARRERRRHPLSDTRSLLAFPARDDACRGVST